MTLNNRGNWSLIGLLAAVAIQFMLNAVRQLNPAWFPSPT